MVLEVDGDRGAAGGIGDLRGGREGAALVVECADGDDRGIRREGQAVKRGHAGMGEVVAINKHQPFERLLLRGGGGINPDEIVLPQAYNTRFEAVMDMSNSFFEFAQEYLRNHKDITEDFEVSSELLDRFHSFLDSLTHFS